MATGGEPKQQPRQWWKGILRSARKGGSAEAASLLPKQTQPLSFDTAAFRRQHVTGAACCGVERAAQAFLKWLCTEMTAHPIITRCCICMLCSTSLLHCL